MSYIIFIILCVVSSNNPKYLLKFIESHGVYLYFEKILKMRWSKNFINSNKKKL